MLFMTIDEILDKINREQNLQFILNEANLLQSEGGRKIQVLKPRPSITSTSSAASDVHPSDNPQSQKNQRPQQMSSSILSTATRSNQADRNNNKLSDEDEVSVVLITGCGSKIGCNIAVGFAQMGLRVALVDSSADQVELVALECEAITPKKSRKALQIIADISQLDQAHRVIDRTIQEFGRLDVLVNTVNNGGLMEAKYSAGASDDDPHVFEQYHKIIANNMHAVTYLCISAAPYLRKTKGSIVNVSHITNNESGSYKFAYCMSKAGIATLTKCLATDLAPDIKVICACPKS